MWGVGSIGGADVRTFPPCYGSPIGYCAACIGRTVGRCLIHFLCIVPLCVQVVVRMTTVGPT